VIVVLSAVLAECVFVLESFYEHPRLDIASALGTLISSPGVEIGGAPIHLEALDRYRKTKAHFVDCLIAATAATARSLRGAGHRAIYRCSGYWIDSGVRF
jgi:predicted nucleic-acid-binding protein